jgi:hypothetical protein
MGKLLKRVGYGASVLILLALFLVLLDPAGLISLGKNVGYVFVGVLMVYAIIVVANRTGITGHFFTMHDWLDDIHGRPILDPDGKEVGRVADPHATAKAIVIAAILLAGATAVSRFIG